MENTHFIGFNNSYKVSDYESSVAYAIERGFGMYAECNYRYLRSDSTQPDGLVYKVIGCTLINYKPCFDPSMKHDPKRFTDGVHNTLLTFVDRFGARFDYLDDNTVLLSFTSNNNK
jgi:diacylglycerol kinase family enzyme